jgi:hypothetical protein
LNRRKHRMLAATEKKDEEAMKAIPDPKINVWL